MVYLFYLINKHLRYRCLEFTILKRTRRIFAKKIINFLLEFRIKTCKILVHNTVSFHWLNIIYCIKHFISWDKTTKLSPRYMTFTYIVHLQRVIMHSHKNHSPVGLVAQLVDQCVGIAEVRVWILFRPEHFQVSFCYCSDHINLESQNQDYNHQLPVNFR